MENEGLARRNIRVQSPLSIGKVGRIRLSHRRQRTKPSQPSSLPNRLLGRGSLRQNLDRDAAERLAARERAAAEARIKVERERREAEEKHQAAEAEKRRAEFEAEQAKLAAEREAAAKERARRDYPFSAESFEAAWPAIRAAMAAEEMIAARKRVADPRSYMNGLQGYASPNTD